MNEQEAMEIGNSLTEAQLKMEQAKLDNVRQDVMMQEIDKGMISEQLDVSEILTNIYYLLKGWVLTRNDSTGSMRWTKPTNNDMIVLSDHGVNYILGAVQWYVNKNTLLSNYEDEIILQKMEDFATTITDNVFMDYEHMFLFPTNKDCEDELNQRIKLKVDNKMFVERIKTGKEGDPIKIKQQIIDEMGERLNHEIEVIKQQKLKSKLKRFESIIRFVQDTVHSAYNRAWKGQERRTLREHIHISESKGNNLLQNKPQYTMNPIKAWSNK